MAKRNLDAAMQDRTARLAQMLEMLTARGMTQQQVAFAVNVPSQYLSDLKHDRRPMSAQFARRFGDVFGISPAWLLQGEGPMEVPAVAPTAPPAALGVLTLPVLSAPCQGDPRESADWDGSTIALTGAAAAAAERASLPFVLRVGDDDPTGRLRKNDLLLCSQQLRDGATIVVVRNQGKLILARCTTKKHCRAFDTGRVIRDPEVIGHCVGIVWAAL